MYFLLKDCLIKVDWLVIKDCDRVVWMMIMYFYFYIGIWIKMWSVSIKSL